MTTPCPRDHAALTTAFCPNCGTPKILPVPDDPLEAFCVDLLMKAVGRHMPATARDITSKARELLCQPAKREEFSEVRRQYHAMMESEFAAWLHDRGDAYQCAAPPAQPEPSRNVACPECGGAMIGRPLMCAKHGEPSAQPEPIVFGGTRLCPTCHRIGEACTCSKVAQPGAVNKAGEPPAPATSATIALDAWLDSHDVMQSTRSEVHHCYRADFASATKALQERAEKAERERNALRAGFACVACYGNHETVGQLKHELDEARTSYVKASKERAEQKAENEKLQADVELWKNTAKVEADKFETAKRELATLRASQPAGLPKQLPPPEVGEKFEVWMKLDEWVEDTVCLPQDSRGVLKWDALEGHDFGGVDHGRFFLRNEGKTWRRVSAPTGEKGKG